MQLSPDFLSELCAHFSGEIRADAAMRLLYSTDASIYQVEPLGVAIPRTQDDLQAAVELAAKYRVPILPRGSGSSLAGQAIGQALILDTSRHLDKIIAINPEAQTATVEPGVILARLNKVAAQHGLMFGPDPASAERATLGGVIGNNATGAHSILYGMTADHLLSADVLFSDGSRATLGEIDNRAFQNRAFNDERSRMAHILVAVAEIRQRYADAIRTHWPRTWRNSAGYRLNYLLPWSPTVPPQWYADENSYPARASSISINLAPLLAGSEGTLAIIQRATVRLVAKPRHTLLAVIAYDSVPAACDDVPRLLGFLPSAVELIPRMLLRLARDVPAYARMVDFVEGDPAALLVIEFSGEDPLWLQQQAAHLGSNACIVTAPEAQARIWAVRKVGLGILDSGPTASRPVAFIEDCAIPVDHLGDFVREVDRLLTENGTQAAYYAQASAGCLHIKPLLDLHTGAGVHALRAIAEAVHALTVRFGGAMSSEHGDGLARAEFLEKTYGETVMEAFRALKRAADPQNLLHPGNLLGASPLDVNLRYGETYQSKAWPPVLDFSRQKGLTGAIEQCNGAGVCRKTDGVMCPSFQATREEQNATRGRANLLRAISSQRATVSGGQPSGELERAVYEAMGLCLACKGCKAECPSGVDMAKLKYDYQQHYYQSHRRPLRDYLFGYINELTFWAAPFGRLYNLLMRLPLANWFGARLRLAPRRSLPTFGLSSAASAPSNLPLATVLFLPDTFTHFFEPEIESAAMRILAAGGIAVKRLPLYGAGRTLISKGFLRAAQRHAARVLDEIARLDPAGVLPVIGLEPSEIYTLRDEFCDLLPARAAEVERLAVRAWMFDEYFIRQARLFVQGEPSSAPGQPILLHGHCYQKAQPPAADGFPVGQAATADFLRYFGYAVEIIPSGCCGMAGAFGYEAEHYDVSMAVGELTLFPAVRARGQKQVVAVGASCRAQIGDGTGAQAHHALNLALQALEAGFKF